MGTQSKWADPKCETRPGCDSGAECQSCGMGLVPRASEAMLSPQPFAPPWNCANLDASFCNFLNKAGRDRARERERDRESQRERESHSERERERESPQAEG